MPEKKISEMTIEELIEESHRQYDISSNARCMAEHCETKAVDKFLTQNNLIGTILHKPTGKRGILHYHYDYRGLVVEFYPLKKNGEESVNRSAECTEWIACRGLERNFEHFLEVYEPVKE